MAKDKVTTENRGEEGGWTWRLFRDGELVEEQGNFPTEAAAKAAGKASHEARLAREAEANG